MHCLVCSPIVPSTSLPVFGIERHLAAAEDEAVGYDGVRVGADRVGRALGRDGFPMVGHSCTMPNRLANETSPYLLQHAENPVDWFPWGEEALALARETDRPLLVSIGYSACHWCHVMERESFEDPQIAALMNEHYVCVKVDREERPDVDAIYMDALQAMTGHGGWPLNAFLRPDGVPFYAGTYYPPQPRQGHAELAAGARGRRARVARAARGDRDLVADDPAAAAGRRRARAARRRGDRARARGGRHDAAALLRRRARRLGRAAEVPAGVHDRVPAAARRARDGAAHAAPDGLGRHVRPGRRRLRALQRRRPLDRPALREDALRQRAARPRVPARVAAHRRAAVPAHRHRDPGLGAARAAPGGGRLRVGARRRLRGRRGQVLRLDARRRCATRSPRTSHRPRCSTSGSCPAATSRA